tara:strand:+ start:2080 stop:3774 length:1695 start_codon:yes stop_codon:yes gene_type:complete
MIKNNKLSLISIFLIGILFIGIVFVNSEGEEATQDIGINVGFQEGSIIIPMEEPKVFNELTDIGLIFGLPEGAITGQGVSAFQLGNGVISFTFNNEDSNLKINGNEFNNIVGQESVDAKLPSFIEVDKNGELLSAAFTVNEQGGTYVFGNIKINIPPIKPPTVENSRVIFNEKTGILIKVPEGFEMTEFPHLKDASLPSDFITKYEGENFELPNGVTIDGQISYDDGHLFVDLNDLVEIHNVEIYAKEQIEGHLGMDFATGIMDEKLRSQRGRTNIFFDECKQKGSYACFDFKNKKLILSSENIDRIASFKEGNPFIRIDEGDHFLAVAHSRGEIEIQNRDSEGSIPRVITKGNFIIQEDHKSIESFGEEVSIDRSQDFSSGLDKSTTTPIELFAQDKDGNNLLGNEKIIVDNANRIGLGLEGKEEFLYSPEGIIDVKFSSRLNYNNLRRVESIEVLTGTNIVFEENVPQGQKEMILVGLRDYWNALSLETKDDVGIIEEIEFVSNKIFRKRFKSYYRTGSVDFAVENSFIFFPEKVIIRSNSVINNPEILEFLNEEGFISNQK